MLKRGTDTVPFAVRRRPAIDCQKHFLNALTANFREAVHVTHPNIQVSLVSPGIVATEFGNNALGGGPDSRRLPNAQSAEAVAEVIAGVIESRKADVYTFPGAREMVVQYYRAER